MASLFHSRELSTAFVNRNIVNQSVGIRTVDDQVVFKVTVDFGAQGRLERRASFSPKGVRIHKVMEEVKAYQAELKEIIDALHEFYAWASAPARLLEHLDNGPRPVFTKMILENNRPLMLHAVRRRNRMVFQMFGEGINGLEITQDYNNAASDRGFYAKILDMVKTLEDHIQDVKNVSFFETMDGAEK